MLVCFSNSSSSSWSPCRLNRPGRHLLMNLPVQMIRPDLLSSDCWFCKHRGTSFFLGTRGKQTSMECYGGWQYLKRIYKLMDYPFNSNHYAFSSPKNVEAFSSHNNKRTHLLEWFIQFLLELFYKAVQSDFFTILLLVMFFYLQPQRTGFFLLHPLTTPSPPPSSLPSSRALPAPSRPSFTRPKQHCCAASFAGVFESALTSTRI